MSVIVYPRLYTTRLPDGDSVVVSEGDESIEMLYKILLDRNTNSRSWPFYRNVLSNAMRLFGDLRTWIQDQKSNPNLVGYNAQFLMDTINFIETGKRELSVGTWSDLLTEGGTAHHANAVPPHLTNSRATSEISDSSNLFLQKWVSQPNGLEDLLMTLHLCFGKARNL